MKSIQSSDSGADLSEYLKNDLETSWHKYWALNGERIIWNSWIAKYSDYINPDFLQEAETLESTNQDSAGNKKNEKTLQFSFDKKDVEKYAESSTDKDDSSKKTFQGIFL